MKQLRCFAALFHRTELRGEVSAARLLRGAEHVVFCAPFLALDHDADDADSDAKSDQNATHRHASPALAFVLVTNHRVIVCPRTACGALVSAVGSRNVQCLLQDIAHVYCSSQSLEMIVRVRFTFLCSVAISTWSDISDSGKVAVC